MYINDETIKAIAKDYNVKPGDLRIAGAAVAMTSKSDKDETQMDNLLRRLHSLLNETELMQAIAWASFIQHKKTTENKSLSVQDVIELKEQTAYV